MPLEWHNQTKSGRGWRKVSESDAQSVLKKVMNLMITDGMESERTVC